MTRKGFLKGLLTAAAAPATMIAGAKVLDEPKPVEVKTEYVEVMPLCWECPYCGALVPKSGGNRIDPEESTLGGYMGGYIGPDHPSLEFRRHVNACREINGSEEAQAESWPNPVFEEDTGEFFHERFLNRLKERAKKNPSMIAGMDQHFKEFLQS